MRNLTHFKHLDWSLVQILTDWTARAAWFPLPHEGCQYILRSQNLLTARGSAFFHGLSLASGKYPLVPPTATFIIWIDDEAFSR